MAFYDRHEQHCPPRRMGEPYIQYLTRYKTWQMRRDRQFDAEEKAARLARLPTPESSTDSDDDTASDIELPDHSRRCLNTLTAGPPVVDTMTRSPTSPLPPSPISQAALHSAARTPSMAYPDSRRLRKIRRYPRSRLLPDSPRSSDNDSKIMEPPRHFLRSRARLSTSTRRFFELDHHGRPRNIEAPAIRMPER